MTLPAALAYTNAATEAARQQAFEDLRDVVAQAAGTTASVELTISGGSVDASATLHSLDGEGDAADVLNTIVADDMEDGALLVIRAENAARPITLTHASGGAGQMSLRDGIAGYTLVLDDTSKSVWFRLAKGSPDTWHEIGRFGFVTPVVARTANLDVENHHHGTTFTNDAASGTVAFTLPPASTALGRRFRFAVLAAFALQIVPDGSDTVRNAATDSATGLENSTVGSVIEIECMDADTWVATSSPIGTWAAI